MTAQLLVFVYWSNIVTPNFKLSVSFAEQDRVCIYLLLVSSIYLLLTEIPLIIKFKHKWLLLLSSMANTISNVLLIAVTVTEDRENVFSWQLMMIVALLIWWRFVLYLRTFEKFSWMVRLIQQSFYDMRYFFLVFFFIIFSYADAYLSLKTAISLRQALISEEEGSEPAPPVDTTDLSFYEIYFKTYIVAV